MDKATLKSWVIAYLRQPFRLIVWFMETFAKNRARLKEFMARPRVVSAFKSVVTVTLFVWIAVFILIATHEDNDRFTCAVKSLMPGVDRSGCPLQPWESAPKPN